MNEKPKLQDDLTEVRILTRGNAAARPTPVLQLPAGTPEPAAAAAAALPIAQHAPAPPVREEVIVTRRITIHEDYQRLPDGTVIPIIPADRIPLVPARAPQLAASLVGEASPRRILDVGPDADAFAPRSPAAVAGKRAGKRTSIGKLAYEVLNVVTWVLAVAALLVIANFIVDLVTPPPQIARQETNALATASSTEGRSNNPNGALPPPVGVIGEPVVKPIGDPFAYHPEVTGYTYLAPPSIPFVTFRGILEENDSPMLPEAEAIYSVLVSGGIDPALWLAHVEKEVQFGHTGTGRPWTGNLYGGLNNPGGVRGTISGRQIALTPYNMGVYPNYTTAVEDWVWLLTTQGLYIDAGLTTPDAVVRRYAPPSENNTEGYIAAMHAFVDTYRARVDRSKPPANTDPFTHIQAGAQLDLQLPPPVAVQSPTLLQRLFGGASSDAPGLPGSLADAWPPHDVGDPPVQATVETQRLRVEIHGIQHTGSGMVTVIGTVHNISQETMIVPASAFVFVDSMGASYVNDDATKQQTLAPGQWSPLSLSLPLPEGRGLALHVTLGTDPIVEQQLIRAP